MPVLVEMNMSFAQLLRAVHAPRLVGGDEPAGPGAHGEAARPRGPRPPARAARPSPDAGVFARLTDWGRYQIGDTYSAANEGLKGRIVARPRTRARAATTFDTLLDVVLADDLRTVLWPLPTDDDDGVVGAARARRGTRDDVLLGGSDAGAHLDRMCGAPYTTRFLADCLRGRKLVPLERAVQLHHPGAGRAVRPARPWRPAPRAPTPTSCSSIPRRSTSADVTLVARPARAARRGSFADAIGVAGVFVNGRAIVRDGAHDRRPARDGPAVRPRHPRRSRCPPVPDRVARAPPDGRQVAGDGGSSDLPTSAMPTLTGESDVPKPTLDRREWIDGGGGSYGVVNPATEAVDRRGARGAARPTPRPPRPPPGRRSPAWKRTTPEERANLLAKLGDEVQRRGDDLLPLIMAETGATLKVGSSLQVPQAVARFDRYAKGALQDIGLPLAPSIMPTTPLARGWRDRRARSCASPSASWRASRRTTSRS